MTIKANLIANIPVNNTLGEGIQWRREKNELWWADIGKNQLFCYDWKTKSLIQYETPHAVCSFAFVENSELLLIAFTTGLAYYQPDSKELNWIYPDICDGITQRLNDGRVDRQGRFWVGSMMLQNVDSDHPAQGKLYCLNTDEHLSIHETGIHISNGTCWSPDSKLMYFADSAKNEMYVYDFDPLTGTNSNRSIFVKTPNTAFPDGANVDALGNIWSAQWGAEKVVAYTPDAEPVFELDVAASQPTCIAFGGNDLNLLFVSSANQDLGPEQLASEPQAGNVFVYQTNCTGLPETKYQPVKT